MERFMALPTYFEISSEPRNEALVTYTKCNKANLVRDDCARWVAM